VRPRGDRNFEAHTVSIAFSIDEGPRTYIERINLRGKYAYPGAKTELLQNAQKCMAMHEVLELSGKRGDAEATPNQFRDGVLGQRVERHDLSNFERAGVELWRGLVGSECAGANAKALRDLEARHLQCADQLIVALYSTPQISLFVRQTSRP
jgi:hypothetical protein